MNERIKELVNLASEYADHYDKIGVDHSFQNIFNEKFAELIVAECMRLNSKELSITAIERLLPLYAEHFGVE